MSADRQGPHCPELLAAYQPATVATSASGQLPSGTTLSLRRGGLTPLDAEDGPPGAHCARRHAVEHDIGVGQQDPVLVRQELALGPVGHERLGPDPAATAAIFTPVGKAAPPGPGARRMTVSTRLRPVDWRVPG